VVEAATPADICEIAEVGQLGHHPTHCAVRHSSSSGNLAVRASHELGPCEEGKENLQARRLKRSAALRVGSQISGALTLHEYHEGWLIQEGVAGGIDKLDALGPQRVG
jgi:hypothetical protein